MGLRRRAGVETSNSSAFRKGAPADRLARDVGFVNPVSGRSHAQRRWMSVATANGRDRTNERHTRSPLGRIKGMARLGSEP